MSSSPFNRFANDFKNKKVLVMGLGLLGKGTKCAQLFCEIGASVRITDLKNALKLQPSLQQLSSHQIDKYRLGKHDRRDFKWADIILKNPAVPAGSPYLKYARSLKKKIVMDTSLFCQYCGVKIVGVTGTRGKSTTSALIYNILKENGIKAVLGGNVPGVATLALLKKIKPNTVPVLELSSWQLQGLKEIAYSPHIAVVTNIYPDHLNYYKNNAHYLKDKKNIGRHQQAKDFLILNKNCPKSKDFARISKAKLIYFNKSQALGLKTSLPGEHNLANIAAACAVAKLYKLPAYRIAKSVQLFTGLDYRIQKIASCKGISFINDSTSTTPAATIAAINSMTKTFYLVLGGNGKNLPDEKMLTRAGNKAKGIYLLAGNYSPTIKEKLISLGFGKKINNSHKSLKELVADFMALAKSGEQLLFSPGYTSFGMFNNEFDRAIQFNKAVKLYLKNAKKKTNKNQS